MTQTKIKVTLSDGSSVLKNWEQASETDVSGLVDAVKQVKQSLNDYLTELVNQEKSVTLKEQVEHSNGEDEEEEEETENDVISGFIKNMGIASGQSKRSKKQKNSKGAKKLKR